MAVMYGYYGFYYDPTYILLIIGMILSLAASAMVQSTFARYNSVRSRSGLTGAEAAERILRSQGIYDVKIAHISGKLTDNYNPSTKVLSLSDSVFASASVAAVGVAAHECGHAIQHAKGYVPITIRGIILPFANWGARLSWILIIIGLFINSRSSQMIIDLGIFAFSLAVLFQLVTLPVEFNASARALKQLESMHLLDDDELRGTRKVLTSATMTYVAAAASSILQLLRLILLFGGRKSER